MCSPLAKPVPASDLDIYSEDDDTFKEVKKLMEKNFHMKKKHENALSLTFAKQKDLNHPFYSSPTIQLIKLLQEGKVVTKGNLATILANFDFSVIRLGLISSTAAMADSMFLSDELKKRLRIQNIHCPIPSSFRIAKYVAKGYYAPPSEVIKLFQDWDNRTPEYRRKLIDEFIKIRNGQELTQKEIDQLEALMRID
jgi:hypothetical protein